jgi:ubiquinone/menaquinone biosynthesis C-methylase UbiE
VLDLGSGAGNDCFVARSMVGDSGYVIGVDFSQEMVDKAIANRQKLGYENVSFRSGDIESLPVADGEVDYVLSNCVMNLVPDKAQAFGELYRTLKPGGVFSISDIVTDGELPAGFKEDASLYAGCIAGALERETYLSHIRSAGFEALTIHKEKHINLPDSLLQKHLAEEAIRAFREGAIGIVSITVQGHKPTA